jgi:hypothetical protein
MLRSYLLAGAICVTLLLSAAMELQAQAGLTWGTGLGAITHLQGPTDQPFTLGTQNNQNIVLAPNGTGTVNLNDHRSSGRARVECLSATASITRTRNRQIGALQHSD